MDSLDISLRNQDCIACELSKDSKFVCELRLPMTIKHGGIMVIGDYPSTPEDAIYICPLRESKFDLFWKTAIKICGIPEDAIYATYAAKCKSTIPTLDQSTTCASIYIKKEILLIRPKVIILLGATVGTLFGFGKDVTKVAGQTKEITFGKGDNAFKVTLLYTFSPTYVEYNPLQLKKFATHINKAATIISGKSEDEELPTRVTMCTTIAEVQQVIDYVLETKQCTFDFETTKLTDLNTFDPNFKATLIAISFQHGSAYTIPLFHIDSPFSEKEVMQILQMISDNIWTNPEIHKINQNIKFDMRVAARYGFSSFRGRLDCTMIMHSLYDDLNKHSIKEWLPTFFPQFLGWDLEVKGKYGDDVPLKTLSNYAGIDADGAFRGYTVLLQKLLEDQRVYDLYRNLYMFALRPLFNMEMRGMPIDRAAILKYEERALELIAKQEAKMNQYIQVAVFNKSEHERVKAEKLTILRERKAKAKGKNLEKVLVLIRNIKAGITEVHTGINFGSPDQLNDLLYSQEGFGFKVPYNKKARGPKKATGSEVIKGLGDKTGFINDLLVLRSLKTTYSKYLKGIRLQLDENDCVHTTYNQANTKTGRSSSGGTHSGPNLQNIVSHVKIKNPLVEELTELPKKAFIVPKGYVLINCDFSQAELRMMAEFSNCKALIQAYLEDNDVHILTACSISGLTINKFLELPEKERKELRQKAKSANFGLIYGQSAEGFQGYAKNVYGVDMSLKEATRIKDIFFEAYPEISDYHTTYIAKGKKFGYVRSLFGRRAHYPDINALDNFLKGNAERELINMPVQSSNGENTILALALLEQRLPTSVLLSNTVHDNIMMFAPLHLAKYAIKVAKDTCENTPQLKYFGKEMTKLKMKSEIEISITSWKGLNPYSDELAHEFNLK